MKSRESAACSIVCPVRCETRVCRASGALVRVQTNHYLPLVPYTVSHRSTGRLTVSHRGGQPAMGAIGRLSATNCTLAQGVM